MSAEHDLQQTELDRFLERVRLTLGRASDPEFHWDWKTQYRADVEALVAALSRVGERIDAQQHRILELEGEARSLTERVTRAEVGIDAALCEVAEAWEIGTKSPSQRGKPPASWMRIAPDVEQPLTEAFHVLADLAEGESATEPVSRGPVSGAGGNT